jgi:hypothetical protein
VGEQAYTLRGCSSPKKYLELKLNATEIARNIARDCGSYNSYRLAINTFHGDSFSYIAGGGCHNNNKICGTLNTTNFVIVGGGIFQNDKLRFKGRSFRGRIKRI